MKSGINVPVILVVVIVGLFLVFLAGHNTGYHVALQQEARGFELPDGNPQAGKALFAEQGCRECHTVSGSQDYAIPENAEVQHIVLGGQVRVMKTDGELVTAIINHGQSAGSEAPALLNTEGRAVPPDLSDRLTAKQLSDLVAFLKAHYEVTVTKYPENPMYYPYGVDVVP